jgi:hypothetical protein
VHLDAFKFVGIGLDKLRVLPKTLELRLSKCIDDAFTVPNTEAELAGSQPLNWLMHVLLCHLMRYLVCFLFMCYFKLSTGIKLTLVLRIVVNIHSDWYHASKVHSLYLSIIW